MYRFSPKFALRPAALSACAAAIVCLSGCAGISGTAVPSSLTTSIPKGSLYGGQQPIAGARIYVYAASTPTTGGSYGSASASLILTGLTGTTTDANGNAYVTTDNSGSFNYAERITCPASTSQIYLLALGGNTTGHRAEALDNPAIALSAALGSCSTINTSTFTSINEVTTAAMVFALNPFMLDATHIGSPSSNNIGLVNAFATIPNLVNNTTGSALAMTPGGNGVAPQATLNTLANIVAPCANSGSNTSAACSSLFSHSSTSAGSPTSTVGALLNIATFPAAQVANLYSDAVAPSPFQPALTAQPNDFSLGIAFSASTSVIRPGAVVIDATGNIWTSNCQSCASATAPDSLVEFSPNGAYLGSFTGNANPATQVLHQIQGIAIERTSGFIYTSNLAIGTKDDEVIKMPLASNSVTFVHSDNANFGVDAVSGVALDNADNVWITSSHYPTQNLASTITNASSSTAKVVKLSSVGTTVAVFNPGTTGFSNPLGVGTDNIGNVWVADAGSGPGTGSLGKFTGGAFNFPYTPSGLNEPSGIMIDGNNNIWTVDQFQPALSQIKGFNGTNASGGPYTNLALYQAVITAVDGAGQVLIPSCRQGCFPSSGLNAPDGLIRVSQTGVPNTGAAPGPSAAVQVQLTGGGSPTYALNGVGGVAIDASGNVWVSNSVSGKLTQVIGFAAPTRQPIALTSHDGTIGLLP